MDVQALINFYTLKGFNRHVQTLCKDALKKRSNEPTLLFWRAFAMGAEGIEKRSTYTRLRRVA